MGRKNGDLMFNVDRVLVQEGEKLRRLMMAKAAQ